MDRAHYAALIGVAAAALAGCSPKIGSKCVLNTDCGTSGALVCDTSQPGGYCTEFNCTPNSCQDRAACVEFRPSVPGCPYDDYSSPSRTGRTFCMEHCAQDTDCRQSDGYVCANPGQPPWNAAITDNNQSQSVCIIAPDPGASASLGNTSALTLPDGSVCAASGPAVPPIEAGGSPPADAATGGGPDGAAGEGGEAGGGGDAAADASADAGADSGEEAALEGGLEDGVADDGSASEGAADSGGADAPGDAAPDAGADAQGGG